jgi:hypothetical protein
MIECYEEVLSKEVLAIIKEIWLEEEREQDYSEETLIKFLLSDEYVFKKAIILTGLGARDLIVFSQKYLGITTIPEMNSLLSKPLKKWFKTGRINPEFLDLSDNTEKIGKMELVSAMLDVYNEICEDDSMMELQEAFSKYEEVMKFVMYDEYGVRKLMVILGLESEELKNEIKKAFNISAISKYIGKNIRKQMREGDIVLAEINLLDYC